MKHPPLAPGHIDAPHKVAALGLSVAGESVDEWAGTVLTRRYEGRCDTAQSAAAAVRFLCEESEQQMNLAAE